MTRVNEKIRAPRIRVVMGTGEQMGVMDTRDALQKAKSIGLDLVEVAANVNPPVCRIVDYGKYKYEQSKLKKGKPKTTTKMKEVKFRVRTEDHDYNIKMGRAETFLSDGNKVRIQLQFRGRENAHRDLGFVVMKRIAEDLKTMANVDQPARLSGRNLGMVLSPLPKDQRVRKFKLSHGDLIEEDDFEDDEEDMIDEDGNPIPTDTSEEVEEE